MLIFQILHYVCKPLNVTFVIKPQKTNLILEQFSYALILKASKSMDVRNVVHRNELLYYRVV